MHLILDIQHFILNKHTQVEGKENCKGMCHIRKKNALEILLRTAQNFE
jgi:hypothetical protein